MPVGAFPILGKFTGARGSVRAVEKSREPLENCAEEPGMLAITASACVKGAGQGSALGEGSALGGGGARGMGIGCGRHLDAYRITHFLLGEEPNFWK